MTTGLHFITGTVCALVLATGAAVAGDGGDDASYCMDVVIEPFHMMPGFMTAEGACAVRDYWEGELQEAFYPFTIDDHKFNCEVSGDTVMLPIGEVPSSVASQHLVAGTIGGYPFEARLFCASLTNYYERFCDNPTDPEAPCFQLAQPFLMQGLPFPRVTEVSLFDGVITVEKGRKTVEVPVVLVTRAAGITHVEDLTAPLVGASVTHSLLGMVAYESDEDGEVDDLKVLEGSADLLLQGHIFFPGPVEEDVDPETGANEAAVIKGAICSKDLHKMLNRRGNKGKKGKHRDDD